MLKYCFVLPCYQHGFTLGPLLETLKSHQLKIFVDNDGSDEKNTQAIRQVCREQSLVELIELPVNQGKGVAVSQGLQAASAQGFTHAIQIDSDGQHDLGKIDELLELSRRFPQDLISGKPQYDESVPKSRLYGRYATHIWVWIETLSFQIKDSLCGFRVYPLAATMGVLNNSHIGKRMDFDAEIMVRLYWQGLNVHQIPVGVRYPQNGISHFDVVKDNVRITKMHTRLFFGMLPRIPKLLFRRRSAAPPTETSWHRIEEFGSILGIRILILFYRLTGRKILNLILYPVSIYYSFISLNAQKASEDLRQRLKSYSGKTTKSFTTFQHIHSFANSAIDKFAVWAGDIRVDDLHAEDVQALLDILKSEQGAFFLTSHYGNIEVCRALGRYYPHVQFNALVYQDNAKRFNDYLNKVNSDSSLNLISVRQVGPEISFLLKQKVDNKEWVFMVGDRTSIHDQQRIIPLQILGAPAIVSEGPFIMAYLLDVPIYVIHCFRVGKKFRIQLKAISVPLEKSKANRSEYIRQIANQYGLELQSLIQKDPLQWFNFFDFWRMKA